MNWKTEKASITWVNVDDIPQKERTQKKFDRNIMYCGHVQISEPIIRKNSAILCRAKEYLLENHINKVIPKRYRHRIKWEIINPNIQSDPLGERGAILWKYMPLKRGFM